MSSSLEWHFIGHLQRNKVRKVLPLVNMVHSVDSLQIAKRINDIASDSNCVTMAMVMLAMMTVMISLVYLVERDGNDGAFLSGCVKILATV